MGLTQNETEVIGSVKADSIVQNREDADLLATLSVTALNLTNGGLSSEATLVKLALQKVSKRLLDRIS